MLAIKSALANRVNLSVLIFDEIDTGISGEVARKVGTVMKNLSANHQLFAITHLPQIGAVGANHYRIFKAEKNQKAQTGVELLSPDQRIVEIATMLSGENPPESAVENAKTLLS